MAWSIFICRISKRWDSKRSLRYLGARDYPDAARRVVKAMHEQMGELRVDENGLALRGVIVRHLVMPGLLEDRGEVVRWLAGELSHWRAVLPRFEFVEIPPMGATEAE
jgi:uncharacterized Fe-S radical SAM superfamily protein PflX